MREHKWVLAALLAAALAPPAAAHEVTVHGQIRPRYEFRDPSGTGRDEFTSMRVRGALEAALDAGVSVFIQVQDVRLWGEEANTLTDFRADNLDMHQAYLRYRAHERVTATLGRQETDFGGQRLVGAVDWTQQGRSFDGVRLDLSGGPDLTASLVAYQIADATAPAHDADAEFFGAYATFAVVGPGALDLYVLHDRSEAPARTGQTTFGARYAFGGEVAGRFEGSIQRGDRAGTPVSAFMVGARLGRTFAKGRVGATLWYDYLSGDADPDDGETGVFSTLYATNHKFYGFADLFLDIPAHTAGAGLQDLALKLTWSPMERLSIGADLHSFSAAERGSLSTAHFANELDLTLTRRLTSQLTLVSGLSFVKQEDALAEIGRLSENMTWAYVMFNVNF